MKLVCLRRCLVVLGMVGTVSGKPAPFSAKVALPGVEGVTSVNVGGINRDGLADIAAFEGGKHNKGRQHFAWFEAPQWTRHEFHSSKPGTFIGDSEMADINGDGRLDVGLVSAEGNKVCLAVYLAPERPRKGAWQRHVIRDDFGNCHQLEVGDIDLDRIKGVRHLFAIRHASGRTGASRTRGAD
jgi:hypothetical protein